MKNKNIFLLIIAFAFTFTSCDDFLGDNLDPDGVDKVPVDEIMPVVLFYTALQNYDHSEYGTYLSQCLTTAGKSQTGSYAYKSGWEFLGMNRHPMWRRHFFDVGSNSNQLIKFAEEENSVNYIALTRLLRLLSVQQTTDAFGAIPLSDAYKSSSPKYDSQEQVYQWMLKESEDLIKLFNSAEVSQATNRRMGKDVDRVFAGDMTKWKQVLLAVKARIQLRYLPNWDTSKANEIIATAESALSSWQTPFYKFDGGSSIEKNNMWGRTSKPVNSWESRSNQLSSAIPSEFFVVDMLQYDIATDSIGDPRLPYLMQARANANDVVKCQYLQNNIGMPATNKIEWYPDLYECVLTTDTSSIAFFSEAELHFIIAEAAMWSGDKEKATNHLKEGIKWHMNRLGVPQEQIDAYLNNPEKVPGSSNITLQHVMKEKYIAMYLQVEQWTDLRRYGYSNDDNQRDYQGVIIYPTLKRPHNLYEAYWSDKNQWIQRINYDPETEEKYNREELMRLDAFRNPEWLKKPMIWAPQK